MESPGPGGQVQLARSLLPRSVVVARGLKVGPVPCDRVDQAVLPADSPGPLAGKLAAQRLGLAGPRLSTAYQLVKGFLIRFELK